MYVSMIIIKSEFYRVNLLFRIQARKIFTFKLSAVNSGKSYDNGLEGVFTHNLLQTS